VYGWISEHAYACVAACLHTHVRVCVGKAWAYAPALPLAFGAHVLSRIGRRGSRSGRGALGFVAKLYFLPLKWSAVSQVQLDRIEMLMCRDMGSAVGISLPGMLDSQRPSTPLSLNMRF
jgi:hypothetical protein